MLNKFKIYLTVTVGPDYRLLERFINYYKRIGIENFLVILNTSDINAELILKRNDIKAVYKWIESFSETKKQTTERDIINKFCSHKDWIIYCDLDEFQYYPDGLINSIFKCNNSNINFMEGRMLDRVSKKGELLILDENKKLENQFPIGGFITGNLMNAWDKKIVAARKNKIVGGGHHIFLNHENQENQETIHYKKEIKGLYKDIIVHHFKWDSFVISRMLKYLTLEDPSLEYWKKEIEIFINHYSKYSKINIKDKKFKFHMVDQILDI